jgi:hypothetical protein
MVTFSTSSAAIRIYAVASVACIQLCYEPFLETLAELITPCVNPRDVAGLLFTQANAGLCAQAVLHLSSVAPIPLAQPLKVPLRDQSFHITLSHVELAVLRQCDGSNSY